MTDLDTFAEIRIRARLGAIEHSPDVLVRAQALAAFEADDLLARVYLLIDGASKCSGVAWSRAFSQSLSHALVFTRRRSAGRKLAAS